MQTRYAVLPCQWAPKETALTVNRMKMQQRDVPNPAEHCACQTKEWIDLKGHTATRNAVAVWRCMKWW